MFDDDEDDEVMCPVLKHLVAEYYFEKNGVTVRETMTIKQGEGLFGMETLADIAVQEIKNGEVSKEVEMEMPLQAWIGRLFAVFKETSMSDSNTPSKGRELVKESKENYKYIFKRNEPT